MKKILPDNKLLYCCYPIINHLKPFLDESHGKNIVQNFRDIFIADFIELERNALAMQIEGTLIQQVKYVMAALVDEIILHSSWEGSIQWLGQPLQLCFFSEHLAGECFFTRLNILRQDYINNCDLLEVYYVCLQLGFSGIYRIKGQEYLQGLQVGLYQQILAARVQQQGNDKSQAIITTKKIIKQPHELSFSIIVAVTMMIMLFIYLSFLWAIDRKADRAVRAISNDIIIPTQER